MAKTKTRTPRRPLDPFVVDTDINDYSVLAVPTDGRAPHTVASYIQREDVARLFALAPELRTALARIVAWVDAGCDPSHKSMDVARALLVRLDKGDA